MNGILIIDKPAGITSHDVVARVRRVLHTRRVGHTGTLDPFATGVMVVMVGQATRLARFLDKDEEEYVASVRFGSETDTGDRTGRPKPGGIAGRPPERAEIEAVLAEFRGELAQVPPMYSAKKVEGKKLYEYARKGETLEREPVKVNILGLELLPTGNTSEEDVDLRVRCSAGTYIRTLAEDIGRRLGSGAHLNELRRTHAGKFGLEEAVPLDDLADMADPSSSLIPMERAVEHLAVLTLPDERIGKTRSGLSTRVFDTRFEDGEPVRMVSEAGELVAVGAFISSENVVQPKVVLV